MSVRPSVCPSHVGNASKLMTVPPRSFHHPVRQGLVFDTNFHTLGPRGTHFDTPGPGEPPLPRFQTMQDITWVKQRKYARFRPINCYALEMIEHRHIVTIED